MQITLRLICQLKGGAKVTAEDGKGRSRRRKRPKQKTEKAEVCAGGRLVQVQIQRLAHHPASVTQGVAFGSPGGAAGYFGNPLK